MDRENRCFCSIEQNKYIAWITRYFSRFLFDIIITFMISKLPPLLCFCRRICRIGKQYSLVMLKTFNTEIWQHSNRGHSCTCKFQAKLAHNTKIPIHKFKSLISHCSKNERNYSQLEVL